MTGPAALRAMARAFANFSEFDRFVQGLQAALDQSEYFGRLSLQVDRSLAEGGKRFSAGALTLPLAGMSGKLGTLQVGGVDGEIRQFGADDLHLVAGLADFLSVALSQSLRMEMAQKSPELLRFLLDQAPVGIAAYEADGRLIVANELATRWLRETTVPLAQFKENRGGFHLRASGKLIFGEARLSGEREGWMVVLQDLTAEQARLLELVGRETYRALAEKRRVGFALIESQQLHDGVLRRLPELRAALLPGEFAGPYDAHRVGLVLPGSDGLSVRARLRKLRGVFTEAAGLRLGWAELGRDGSTPEALLEAALKNPGPFEDILRPTLLVHDDSAAVTHTLAMILGKEFKVVQSTSPGRTRELLAAEVFEGFVTELELRNGVNGAELIRYAREKQPGIRPFFTTVQRIPYGLPAGAAETDASVLEKPFDIPTITRTVRARLLD